MDGTRARKIADSFSGNLNFMVRSYCDGLQVCYHHHTHYFVREASFWSYVYKAAGIPASEQ